MISSIEALGLVAATLSAIMFLPQVVKTWRSRSAAGLAAGTLITSTTCVLLWLVYGACVQDVPLIVGNAVNLACTLTLVMFKLRFSTEPPAAAVVVAARPTPAPRRPVAVRAAPLGAPVWQ
jgi:MtN3 and saliva related transmembrane protein